MEDFKKILDEIDLHKDFLSFAREELINKLSDKSTNQEILDSFINPNQLEEFGIKRLIIGVYIIISYCINNFNNFNEVEKDLFEYVARYLELTLKYSTKYNQDSEYYYQILLLVSICYDLSDKVANVKVVIEKLKNKKEGDVQPFETLNNLQNMIIDIIISYLFRNVGELENTIENGLDLGSAFKDLVEKNPKEFRTILGSFQLIRSFKHISGFWQNGESEILNKAKKFLKKAKKNFEDGQEYNLFFITELLEISFREESSRFIHNLPNNSKHKNKE